MRNTNFGGRWLLLSVAALLILSWTFLEGISGPQNPVAATDTSTELAPDSFTLPAAATAGDEVTKNPIIAAMPVNTTPFECAADSLMQQQLKQILQQRKQQSFRLMQQLLQSGTAATDVATIIYQLGGDMVLLAQQRADYPANPNTLIRFEHQSRTISRDMMRLVLQATQSQDYQEVLAALQADPAPQELAWHGQTLLTAILATDPALSPQTLQQVIDHGLQPVFADLVAATALQLAVPLVDTLNMAFSGDRQQLWFHQYRRNNLTLQAAVDGNAALYDYWLAQGVPAFISAADLNAFDLLPFPATEAELNARLPIIRSFMKQGLLPRQFTTLTSWLLLLPQDDALQLSQQLASDAGHVPQQIPAAQQDKRDPGSIVGLSDEIIATNQLFKLHISARQHCGQLYQLGTLMLSLDDADQHYGAMLRAGFRASPQYVAATLQLLSLQQQLELRLASQQWQPFIQQSQQQLLMLTPELRSNYILQQLLHFHAPADVVTLQLQRHYRSFGLPEETLLMLLQQNNNADLQQALLRLPWWQKLLQSRQLTKQPH